MNLVANGLLTNYGEDETPEQLEIRRLLGRVAEFLQWVEGCEANREDEGSEALGKAVANGDTFGIFLLARFGFTLEERALLLHPERGLFEGLEEIDGRVSGWFFISDQKFLKWMIRLHGPEGFRDLLNELRN